MSSAKQITANRANAVLSTGPTSSQGRAKVSHNALKTGLTGRTVLLPADDVAAYQAHTDRIFKLHSPEADEEKRLTQSLADTLWRLERIPSLEAGIYAIGRRELAAQFADEEDEAVRKAMIEAQVFLSYRRDLNNLSVQEARLRRLYEKDEAELKRLIAERTQAEKDRLEARKPPLERRHRRTTKPRKPKICPSILPKLALNFQPRKSRPATTSSTWMPSFAEPAITSTRRRDTSRLPKRKPPEPLSNGPWGSFALVAPTVNYRERGSLGDSI